MGVTKVLARLAAALGLLAAACAHAQLLDEIDLRSEGADAVLQIRLLAPMQFRRASVARSNDLAQAFYDVVATPDLPELGPSERRIAARGELPGIVVRDEADARAGLSRILVVRLARPVPLRVRAGQGNRTIEIVLGGLASSVQARAAPPEPAPAGQYVITLLQSDDPNLQLEAPVPPALQSYQVTTDRRVVDGRTRHEVNIGTFATLGEAEAARERLLPRFPQATIVALRPPAAPAVAAVPSAAAPAPSAVAAAPALPASAPESGPALPSVAETEARAAALLAAAKAARAQGDLGAALESLNRLLELPPGGFTREAQALAGDVRLQAGDPVRARAEYELFLRLYPSGADSDHVRQALAGLPSAPPSAPRARPPAEPTSTLSGSVSGFYYGGASKVRTQEFQDSPISGLPERVSDNTLSATDQRQLIGNVDLNWRYRDADTDMRFVFRDTGTSDRLEAKNRNRLSALYFEHRALARATQVKLGRQSPSGGGVLERFDGVQAGYGFAPKWRVNAVVGVPVEQLLDSRRRFAGVSIDADALTPELSGSVYAIRQTIDGEVDRSALGTELRYFKGGASVSGMLDYDQAIRGLNIASLQGTWQSDNLSVVNFLYDRRSTPMLMLGNSLFFQDPALPLALRLRDLLARGATLDGLRAQVKATTSMTTQGLLGATTPLDKHWQVGADLRLTNIGEIQPVPVILPSGQGRSDNLSLGAQLIGSNLYSERDTHVFGVSLLRGSNFSLTTPDVARYRGVLLSYNNSSYAAQGLQLEPSIRYYRQSDSQGVRSTRWMPGLRITWRLLEKLALESELSAELSRVTGANRDENSHRLFYYLGARYDF